MMTSLLLLSLGLISTTKARKHWWYQWPYDRHNSIQMTTEVHPVHEFIPTVLHTLLTDIDSCACLAPADQCQNDGLCIDTDPVGGGTGCACPCGHDGGRCENTISECCNYGPYSPSPVCLNGGTCNDGIRNAPFCECPPCWTGQFCETRKFIETEVVKQLFSSQTMFLNWLWVMIVDFAFPEDRLSSRKRMNGINLCCHQAHWNAVLIKLTFYIFVWCKHP